MHEVFVEMARDPSIDVTRIGALMELQFKAEAREAERQFNAALSRAIAKMPRVTKDKKNDGVGWKYTTIDNLDRVIRPIYTEEGFTLSFVSEPCAAGIVRVAILRHVAGHQQESRMQLPPDKGAGRNELQAYGGSISYADRYLTRGLFNIISEGEDRDGQGFGALNKKQREAIDDLLHELGDAALDPFLKFMGVKVISDIQSGAYAAATNYLQAKRRQMGTKEK
jgi:hypothetical protein